MIAISACLCGVKCRYDGNDNLNEELKNIYEKNEAILVCPEVMGGLEVPRKPCEIVGEYSDSDNVYDLLKNKKISIKSEDGEDFSYNFLKGAEKALEKIQKYNIDKVILKSKSPSCGVFYVYDGTFSKRLIRGKGIFSGLLEKNEYKCDRSL